MDEQSVSKSGNVSLQIKSFMKTSVVEKYCVLYSRSEGSHPYIDVYENKEAFRSRSTKGKKCDVKKIELQHVKSITGSDQTTSKGKEMLIEIRVKNQKHNLLFDKENDYLEWKQKLTAAVDVTDKGHENSSSSVISVDDDDDDDDDDEVITLNQMYEQSEQADRFVVDIEPTDLAKLCNLTGNKVLMVSTREVAFEDPVSKKLVYTFNMGWMRRFGKKDSVFSFEVGRKCPNGEGEVRCRTEKSKEIHKLITSNSSSRSKTVIPASRPRGSSSETTLKLVAPEPSAGTREAYGIGGPSIVIGRKHPGQSKTPILVPLNLPVDHVTKESGHTPPSPRQQSGTSKQETSMRHSGKEAELDTNGSAISHITSNDVMPGHVSNFFTQELSEIISKDVKNKSGKVKDEQKENEKKENEKKEEHSEKDNKKDKDDKKKSTTWALFRRGKGSDKAKEKLSSPSGQYEEPDLQLPKSPVKTTPEALYDEAIIPGAKPPRADSVQYAQPYSSKGGTPIIPSEPVEYTEVKTVKGNAWKNYGRTEEEMHHVEDYSKIKTARDQIRSNQPPPPIPAKAYDEEEEDDDTYSRLSTAKPKKIVHPPPQHIYGTAGGKEVGPLPDGVPLPDADYDSNSEGESLPDDAIEGLYDDPEYESPAEVMANNNQSALDQYEDTSLPSLPVITSKVPSTKKAVTKQPQESLYEEVS